MLYDKWLALDHTASQGQSQVWSHLIASCPPHPPPPGLAEGREQRTLPACAVPRVTPHLPTISQHSVHVPLWYQSPRARLEFGTHHAGWHVDFWTCLLLVKQTGLAFKNKSRLVNNQKSHNSPQEDLHMYFLRIWNSIDVNHPSTPPEGKCTPTIMPDH